jgi:hypothetical protein
MMGGGKCVSGGASSWLPSCVKRVARTPQGTRICSADMLPKVRGFWTGLGTATRVRVESRHVTAAEAT